MDKIKTAFRWDDIVIPSHSMRQLREIAAAYMHRDLVYSEWGFESKCPSAKGINVLFTGPSGTGKTMASQILANELELDLYRIDLAAVVSKYIGETEKNLNGIFGMAQDGRAVLLFDEADALFGKRSEVKDAHDRYANIEITYLMQRLEEFGGIVVMTTNLNRNLDESLSRRMRYIVEFPFPDAELRTRIWERVFPSQAPLSEELDFRFLGQQFEMSGGNIRNAALSAAFLAADGKGSITMEHVVLAIAREMKRMGRVPSRSEFRKYHHLIRSENI